MVNTDIKKFRCELKVNYDSDKFQKNPDLNLEYNKIRSNTFTVDFSKDDIDINTLRDAYRFKNDIENILNKLKKHAKYSLLYLNKDQFNKLTDDFKSENNIFIYITEYSINELLQDYSTITFNSIVDIEMDKISEYYSLDNYKNLNENDKNDFLNVLTKYSDITQYSYIYKDEPIHEKINNFNNISDDEKKILIDIFIYLTRKYFYEFNDFVKSQYIIEFTKERNTEKDLSMLKEIIRTISTLLSIYNNHLEIIDSLINYLAQNANFNISMNDIDNNLINPSDEFITKLNNLGLTKNYDDIKILKELLMEKNVIIRNKRRSPGISYDKELITVFRRNPYDFIKNKKDFNKIKNGLNGDDYNNLKELYKKVIKKDWKGQEKIKKKNDIGEIALNKLLLLVNISNIYKDLWESINKEDFPVSEINIKTMMSDSEIKKEPLLTETNISGSDGGPETNISGSVKNPGHVKITNLINSIHTFNGDHNSYKSIVNNYIEFIELYLKENLSDTPQYRTYISKLKNFMNPNIVSKIRIDLNSLNNKKITHYNNVNLKNYIESLQQKKSFIYLETDINEIPNSPIAFDYSLLKSIDSPLEGDKVEKVLLQALNK